MRLTQTTKARRHLAKAIGLFAFFFLSFVLLLIFLISEGLPISRSVGRSRYGEPVTIDLVFTGLGSILSGWEALKAVRAYRSGQVARTEQKKTK